jgi:hypothetical protein
MEERRGAILLFCPGHYTRQNIQMCVSVLNLLNGRYTFIITTKRVITKLRFPTFFPNIITAFEPVVIDNSLGSGVELTKTPDTGDPTADTVRSEGQRLRR